MNAWLICHRSMCEKCFCPKSCTTVVKMSDILISLFKFTLQIASSVKSTRHMYAFSFIYWICQRRMCDKCFCIFGANSSDILISRSYFLAQIECEHNLSVASVFLSMNCLIHICSMSSKLWGWFSYCTEKQCTSVVIGLKENGGSCRWSLFAIETIKRLPQGTFAEVPSGLIQPYWVLFVISCWELL